MSEQVSAPTAQASAPAESGAQVNNSTPEGNVQAENSSQGSGGESLDAIQDAVESGEISQADANKMLKKFQLKVRGKMIEREVDLGDEDFMRNQLQLAEVAKMSQQEKAELEKKFEYILQNGKKDPMKFIQEAFGLDPDELAALHIERKIEHLKKSPEVLEKEKIQAELQAAREEAKKLREEKDNVEMSKLQQEQLVSIQSEISNAIKAHTKLPDNRYVQQKMAQALVWAEENGYPGSTAEDVAPMVEAEMRKEMNELYDNMPEELIEMMVGRKNLDRLRNKKIAQAKAVPSVNTIKQTASQPTAEKKQERNPIDSKKFWRGR